MRSSQLCLWCFSKLHYQRPNSARMNCGNDLNSAAEHEICNAYNVPTKQCIMLVYCSSNVSFVASPPSTCKKVIGAQCNHCVAITGVMPEKKQSKIKNHPNVQLQISTVCNASQYYKCVWVILFKLTFLI